MSLEFQRGLLLLMVRILVFVILLTGSSPSFALVQLGIDGNVVNSGFSGVNFQGHGQFLFGNRFLGIGPIAFFHQGHERFREHILGGGIQVGETFFVALEGGVYEKTVFDETRKGVAAILMPGYHFSGIFRVTWAMIYKKSEGSGDNPVKGWRLDGLPMFGITMGF